MKKLLIASILIATLAGCCKAQAATTGTLLLRGHINGVLSVEVDPVGTTNTSLDLTTTQTNLAVANVKERSNQGGYKITITSLNLSSLLRTTGPQVIPYTMRYGGSSVDLSTAAGTSFTTTGSGLLSNDKAVEISYTGVPESSLLPGDYEDIVTFTITVP